MTTQTAIFDGLPTGLTLTGKAFDTDSPDTEVTGNTIAVTEGTNAKGRYSVVITRATVLAAGDYDIRLFSGLVPIAVGAFRFAGTNAETAVEVPQAVELDSATRVKLSSEQPDYAPAKSEDVNAQILDVLTVDTFQELSYPPTATSSLKDKIAWLFMWARNKVVQSTTDRKLYADDDLTIVSTESTVDGGSSFTKGKAT